MTKEIRKKIIGIITCASIVCMTAATISNAAHGYRVQGDLRTSVHYVPVLKDTAKAMTTITNPCDWSSAASKTYSYAYNSSGTYNVAYGEAFNTAVKPQTVPDDYCTLFSTLLSGTFCSFYYGSRLVKVKP